MGYETNLLLLFIHINRLNKKSYTHTHRINPHIDLIGHHQLIF